MQIGNNNLANTATYKLPEPGAPKPDEVEKLEKQEEQIQKPETLNKKTLSENTNTITNFVKTLDTKMMPITAFGSAVINFISAPTRLFDDNNPLKKIINKISMLGTKLHLALYGTLGMWTAHEHKNPFLLFSFAVEALSSLFDLRKIYLFRGLATGIDGAVGAFKDRFEEKNPDKNFEHKNYADGFNTNFNLLKEILNEIKANPKILLELKGAPTLVASSALMILGSFIGLTISDKVGASIRDVFGGFSDFGLTQLESKIARKSGGFALLGTFKDLVARFFTEKNAETFGVTEVEKFKRGRDVMHELALGFDRIGQYYFLRFNQEDNTNKDKVEKTKTQKAEEPKKDLHQALDLNTQLAV